MKQVEAFLDKFYPKIRKELTVEPVETGFLLHLSMYDDKKSKYTPNISARQVPGCEDRTLPRITASTNIIGCLAGFGDFTAFDYGDESEKALGYRGLYLNIIPTDYQITPSSKMIKQVDDVCEKWLVNYDGAHNLYKCRTIGMAFVAKWELIPNTYGVHDVTTTIYIAIETDIDIRLTPTQIRGRGYWAMELVESFSVGHPSISACNKKHIDARITELTKDEFYRAKKKSANDVKYTAESNEATMMSW